MLTVTENYLPTFGERLFDIRARLGDGARKPMSFRDLDDLVFEKTRRRVQFMAKARACS